MKILLIISVIFGNFGYVGTYEIQATQKPVIYITDLFHPKDDADDVYDLATLYGIAVVDVKGIILEQGLKQDERSGSVTVDQLNTITGRSTPYSIGLAEPLTSTTDTGVDQPEEYQKGIEMILNILETSSKRVSIVVTGSLRDVAAAYNREPELFKKKLDRLLIFGGEATTDYKEYNVELDPHAYVQIMKSGLNIYWSPCFDGGIWKNGGKSSYFYVDKQRKLLNGIDDKLLNYFVYNLADKTGDPIQYLEQEPNMQEVSTIYSESRHLWCTGVFLSIFGVYDRDIYDFVPVQVNFTDEGYARYGEGKMMMQFVINDGDNYASYMIDQTNKILKQIKAA